jgi:hypothetical protein
MTTKATSPLSLPAELLHDIALYLDRGSLISFAQSCRVLNAVAVQHLHRTIPRLSGPDTIRCLNTLATTPDIAEKVRTFNIYSSFAALSVIAPSLARVEPPRQSTWNRVLAVFRRPAPPLPPVVPSDLHFLAGAERISLQTVANAFYNMKSLHTLIIYAPSYPRIWEFEHPIPTLRSIFVHRNAESPSLFVWIMRQKSITSLRMNFDQKWLQLSILKRDYSTTPPTSLPNLHSLTCNPQGVLDLFPGGRVSELTIEDLFEQHNMLVIDYLVTVIASTSAKLGIKLQRITLYGETVAITRLLGRLDHLLPNLLFLRIFAVDHPLQRVSSTPKLSGSRTHLSLLHLIGPQFLGPTLPKAHSS